MRIFLSHSSADAQLANEICQKLEAEGHKCFIAPRDIRSGYEYAEELVNGIDGSDMMLLLLTKQANESPHVLREVERAVSKNKAIIVYKVEEVTLSKSMEYFLMTHQWLDVKPGKDHSDIVRAINEYTAVHSGETAAPAALPAVRKHSGKLVFAIIAASVILAAAGVVTAMILTKSAGQHEESSGNSGSSMQESSLIEAAGDSEEVSQNESASSSAASSEPDEAAETESAESDSAVEAIQSEHVNTAADTSAVTEAPTDSSEPEIADPSASSVVSEPDVLTIVPELGSSLVMGEYNGAPIVWRVVHISDDGRSAVVLSDKILTMKAFDAAEGGSYNHYDGESYWTTPIGDIPTELQSTIRGDNRWELSNIRTWLNSAREMVQYTDQPPISKAMSEHDNGYSTEAGFLKGFTADELSVISPTQHKAGETTTTDSVFLLSSDEIQWLYDSDVSVYAEPTPEALEQDTANWYDVNLDAYKTKEHFWWLRDADSTNSCKCSIVGLSIMDSLISTQYVGLEGYGIRPAMTIDLTADKLSAILERSNEIS